VSLHRKERKNEPTPERRTNAELLMAGMDGLEKSLPVIATLSAEVAAPILSVPSPLLPMEEWATLRDSALAHASRPTTVSATALSEEGEPDVEEEPIDEGLQKRPRDLDLPPWLKGRYGSAVGRAVHGVLQTIDLGSGDGLDAAVAAQCEAEAIVERVDDVRQLVNFALTSSHVRNAATAQHWRELYVCVPVGGRLLEGYIDLLYRSTNGLVVVDYKTSSTSDAQELANRVNGYTTQGASYALAVSEAVGEPVVSVAFVFLTPAGPVEIPIANLEQAIDSVRALMTVHI
jgi:ATP-dependent helicase/nuclease subunit A